MCQCCNKYCYNTLIVKYEKHILQIKMLTAFLTRVFYILQWFFMYNMLSDEVMKTKKYLTHFS